MTLKEVIDIHNEENFIFAIAVGADSPGFNHASIIYKWKDKIKVLDFYSGKIRKDCSYGDLGNKDYIYVQYNQDSIFYDFAIQIPVICEAIAEKQTLLNFGITYNNSTFDKEGNLLLQTSDYGLTCATFVLSIFESAGITLINLDSWKSREEDLEWQKYVLNFFINNKKIASEDLIKHFESNLGCFRFRPEEVAAASSFDVLPSNFELCEVHGILLCKAIDNGVVWFNESQVS